MYLCFMTPSTSNLLPPQIALLSWSSRTTGGVTQLHSEATSGGWENTQDSDSFGGLVSNKKKSSFLMGSGHPICSRWYTDLKLTIGIWLGIPFMMRWPLSPSQGSWKPSCPEPERPRPKASSATARRSTRCFWWVKPHRNPLQNTKIDGKNECSLHTPRKFACLGTDP